LKAKNRALLLGIANKNFEFGKALDIVCEKTPSLPARNGNWREMGTDVNRGPAGRGGQTEWQASRRAASAARNPLVGDLQLWRTGDGQDNKREDFLAISICF